MTKLPDRFLGPPLAHRGLHDVAKGRPENSRAAVRAAMDHGYGIEIDVQQTSDGHAVVFHDYDLSRLTDARGAVRQQTLADLAQVTLKGSDEGIPGLNEILELVDGRVPLLIEIKDQDGAMGTDIGTLENSVAELVEGYAGPVAIMSFNPNSVGKMRQLLPGVARGLTTGGFRSRNWPLLPKSTAGNLRDMKQFEDIGASFISHDVSDLENPQVAKLKARDIPVLTWTVRKPEQERKARRVADNITFEGYLPEKPHP